MFAPNHKKPQRMGRAITGGRVEDLPDGGVKVVEMPHGAEVALCNIGGQFYAVENFCPHRGAPLAEGGLCGFLLECNWHGWQFDVRNGHCQENDTVLETYEVTLENGEILIHDANAESYTK